MSQATGDNPKAFTGTASNTPAALSSRACIAVLLQNDPGSAVNLLVGDSNSQPFGLKPGQAVTIPCSNCNEVYVATGSSTATFNGISVS